MYKNAVLRIWYTKDGQTYAREQGKFYTVGKQSVYLADFDSPKPFEKFDGFPIAKQILDTFSKAKLRVLIAYRVKRLGTVYFSKPSDFRKHGWMIPFGGHSQYLLPSKWWKAKQIQLNEPKNLSVMDINKWLKNESEIKWAEGGFEYA